MLIAGENLTLREYLFIKKISIGEFSQHMGYSSTHMAAVVNERLIPSRAMAKAIELATDGAVKAHVLLSPKKNERQTCALQA